jgi:hypothetical protein
MTPAASARAHGTANSLLQFGRSSTCTDIGVSRIVDTNTCEPVV